MGVLLDHLDFKPTLQAPGEDAAAHDRAAGAELYRGLTARIDEAAS